MSQAGGPTEDETVLVLVSRTLTHEVSGSERRKDPPSVTDNPPARQDSSTTQCASLQPVIKHGLCAPACWLQPLLQGMPGQLRSFHQYCLPYSWPH